MGAMMMRPGEVRRRLGIGRKKLSNMVQAGALERVFFTVHGRRVGYGMFRTEEVERLGEATTNSQPPTANLQRADGTEQHRRMA